MTAQVEAHSWGAFCIQPASGRPFLHSGSIRTTRAEVMQYIGEDWHEDWRKGWRIAKRRGWHAVRVVSRLHWAYSDLVRDE